jgi:hypothetical protein
VRALAQFFLRPVVGLFLNVDLDQLASHLVAQSAGKGFQLRELGAPRKTLGIEFPGQFPSEFAQTDMKFATNLGDILAHVCSPLQIAARIQSKTETSVAKVNIDHLLLQTMSCAPRPIDLRAGLANRQEIH